MNYSRSSEDRAQNLDSAQEKSTALPGEWEAALAELGDEPTRVSTEPTIDALEDADEVAAVEALDQAEQPTWKRVARLAGQSRLVRKERSRERNLALKEAFHEATLRIRADRNRAKNTESQQRHRASKDVQNQKALERLMRATANPNGDKRLEQLRGDEVAYTRFYGEFREARESGTKISGAKLAKLYNDTWGENISRDTAIRWRTICLHLEAKGGPWFVRQGPTKQAA